MAEDRDFARGLELKYGEQIETEEGRQRLVADYVQQILADDLSEPSDDSHSSSNDSHRKMRGMGARLKSAKLALEKSERDNKILRRKLREAQAETKRTVQSNADLRRTLTGLRQSKTMRAGRLVSSPLRGLKAAKALFTSSSGRRPQDSKSREDRRKQTVQPSVSLSSPAVASRQVPLSEMVAQLEQGSDDSQLFVAAINELWYRQGSISKTLDLIDLWQSESNSLPESIEGILPEIQAAKHWLEKEVQIPPRTLEPIFRPRRDEILYCVNNSPTYSSNGYATRTRGIVTGLVDNGFSVKVVSRPGFPWTDGSDRPPRRFQQEIDGVTYAHLPLIPKGTSIQDVMDASIDAFLREARRERPEFIQAASNHLTALPALIAARLAGIPFVYEVRGLWEYSRVAKIPEWEGSERFELAVKLESILTQEADHLFAITPQVEEVLLQRGASKSKITVLPNAIDPDRFMPIPKDRAYAAKLGVDLDAVQIGFAGSMVGYEGLDDLVRAFAKMLTDTPNIRAQLILAGSGEMESELKHLVDELKLSDRVLFPGRVPQSDMPRLLSLFDIMPCPRKSSTVTELVSALKPLEGFSTYSAVVLSDVSPNIDLAGENSIRARLVKSGDIDDLSAALTVLCTDSDLRRDLCRQGRMWVLTERSWKQVCKQAAISYQGLRKMTTEDVVQLSNLRVGIIADEFTTAAFSGECSLIPLSRSNWRAQLDGLDFVIIESAWKGNEGQWHRGVGRYSDEEYADIQELLSQCRRRGVKTAFWNKEDPIHTKRFIDTAVQCDAIFTTDANLIHEYRAAAPADTPVLSLPFFSQPKTHNPIRNRESHDIDAFAYAGTYYGDRYPDRTRELLPLIRTANQIALQIFDRQANDPESPYKFPDELRSSVVGALPYSETLQTYKTHVAHLNGNSVADSPTMLSRRVVEIASSGGVVISTPGRAIWELFGPSFPRYRSLVELEGLLNLWYRDPEARRAEAWRQMRAVLRRHTAADALCLIGRVLGLPVIARSRPSYVAVVGNLDREIAQSLLNQTVRPDAVYWDNASDDAIELLAGIPSACVTDMSLAPSTWVAHVTAPQPPTRYEDLLFAAQFGDFTRSISGDSTVDSGRALARAFPSAATSLDGMFKTSQIITSLADLAEDEALDRDTISLMHERVDQADVGQCEANTTSLEVVEPETTRLLVAGHDLKFIEPYFSDLERQGFSISVDKWDGHNQHVEGKSLELLKHADVVLSEWCLGNAVWYSDHVSEGQRLVVRVHLQELDLPYLRQAARKARVDKYLFVNRLYAHAGVISHGIPEHKLSIVPNMVNVQALQNEGTGDPHRIGLVGIVPERKRLDIALDIFEEILTQDPLAHLIIKGKLPEEYPWMKDRPEEMRYYAEQYARVESINASFPGSVVFEGHSDQIFEWYKTLGAVLSTSDFESFHYTIADGAAAGCKPGLLYWPGAEYSYPIDWISCSQAEVVERIQDSRFGGKELEDWIARHYGRELVVAKLAEELHGRRDS